MQFILSNKAVADLEDIWLYTLEEWSQNQADKYLNLIFNEIDYICQHPKSGSDFSNIRAGYYKSRVNLHFIFYRINSNKNTIEVIRILHQQMDIESYL